MSNQGLSDAAATPANSETLRQCADAVLMVRPACFAYNPETALTNTLQRPAAGAEGVASAARAEFEGVVRALASEGVEVCALEDTPQPRKPDAVFPNNWVSFHRDGTVVLYPMQALSRRAERRRELLDATAAALGFQVQRVVDLTHHESSGRFLEGTGSLVLDHLERVAYACLSPRTDRHVLEELASAIGYEPVAFRATDRAGVALYHTNVMLSIGQAAIVVGSEAIESSSRSAVLARLRGSGRDVIEIGHAEIESFAGNLLELASWDEALGDCRVWVMSETARRALSPEALARLRASSDGVLAVAVPTIETMGGGGVRCMLAEVFRPP